MNIPYVMKKCSKCGEWLVASGVNFHKGKTYKYGLQSKCKKCRAEYQQENKEALAEYRRQYYKQNKEAIAEQHRQYRETHKEAKAECGKKYRETHKEAIAEYQRQYHQENKEVLAERRRQYYQANKEALAEQKRQHYQANKEAVKEANNKRNKKYRQTIQGQVVAFNGRNRRRAKEQAQGRGITKEQWLECMSFFNWQCAYSGITLSKETRSLDHIEPINKGGANEIWNLVPMYKPYNISKNDKDFLEWYTEQPYFSQDRLNKIYEWQQYAFNKWGIDTEAQ